MKFIISRFSTGIREYVCHGTGELMVFNTKEAAEKFLDAKHIERPRHGNRIYIEEDE
jgi:hypothetical protein